MEITEYDKQMAREVSERSFKTPKSDEDIFYELIFCICAPQTKFKNNIKVIDYLRMRHYYETPSGQMWLEEALKPVRFYRNKAKWVSEAKEKFYEILFLLKIAKSNSNFEKRNWLVQNVKGLGMKTSSHFLRNLGATDLAIIDTHVLKFLEVNGKWNYEELENRLKDLAAKEGLSIGELDIIIWQKYSKTDWKEYNH